MDNAFDIPDSTDWLNTPLKDFSTLENALHCEICKEFYDTPMITSCSHTFCSKCIRTALSTDGRCPSCRAQDQASKIRNNLALQEVVARFLAARPSALEVARKEQQRESEEVGSGRNKRNGKRKRTVLDSDDIAQLQEDGRTTRSKSRRIAASQTSQQESIEAIDSETDSDFSPSQVQPPEPDDGRVECPLGCGKRMKIEAVEPHLDKCEDEKQQVSRAKSHTPISISSRPPSTQPSRSFDRISELNYSLLTESKLRAKLSTSNIPNWGPKQLMIKRHTEWVNLWNANCDSQHPRSEKELLRELEQWERTQGGRAPVQNGVSSTVMRKDFDGEAWTRKNRGEFGRLIEEARRRKSGSAPEPDKPKDDASQMKDESDQVKNTPSDDVAMDDSNGHTDENGNLLQAAAEASAPPPEDPSHPYENNTQALTSIRAKVQAANAGEHIEPIYNSDFGPPPPDHVQPRAGTENPALMAKNHFGRSNSNDRANSNGLGLDMRARCDVPAHLPAHLPASPPVKRVPMFAVPQQPFSDVDGAGGGGGGGGGGGH